MAGALETQLLTMTGVNAGVGEQGPLVAYCRDGGIASTRRNVHQLG